MKEFMAEKTTEEKLEHIWDGITYHMFELARFMDENKEDPYFETEEGKELKERAMKMLAEHTLGAMNYLVKKLKK